MKRLCWKLANILKVLARDLAAKIDAMPEDAEPAILARTELALRDALAELRQLRNEIAESGRAVTR